MVDQARSFPVGLNAHQGMSLLIVAGMPKADRFATAAGSDHPNGSADKPMNHPGYDRHSQESA